MTALILAVVVMVIAAVVVAAWSICKVAGISDEFDARLQEPRPVEQDEFDSWDWPPPKRHARKDDAA